MSLASLSKNIGVYSTVLDWDINTIFHLGCNNWSDCFKIEKTSDQLTNIPQFPYGKLRRQACVKFKQSLYVFGCR